MGMNTGGIENHQECQGQKFYPYLEFSRSENSLPSFSWLTRSHEDLPVFSDTQGTWFLFFIGEMLYMQFLFCFVLSIMCAFWGVLVLSPSPDRLHNIYFSCTENFDTWLNILLHPEAYQSPKRFQYHCRCLLHQSLQAIFLIDFIFKSNSRFTEKLNIQYKSSHISPPLGGMPPLPPLPQNSFPY